jgi:hypothetical protein
MFWISIDDYTKNFSGTAIAYVEDLHDNYVIHVSGYEHFFTFHFDDPASAVSVVLAQYSEKMQGRIPGWKSGPSRLIVAKETGDAKFPFEYLASRNELYDEEVVIMLGDIDAGTYYVYSDINDYTDGTPLPTTEYTVRVYSASDPHFEQIDASPEGFIESVMGSCMFKTDKKELLDGNDIVYYYGWSAKCGYLTMCYMNNSENKTLHINTILKSYDKEGIIPPNENMSTPEGDPATIGPGEVKVYPLYWYLYKGGNA